MVKKIICCDVCEGEMNAVSGYEITGQLAQSHRGEIQIETIQINDICEACSLQIYNILNDLKEKNKKSKDE